MAPPAVSRRVICASVTAIAAVIILLTCILIPLSFSSLHYYEIGLLKGRTSGRITDDDTYGPGGRFFVGPDKVFQTYPADAHVVTNGDVSLVSSDKLETLLELTFVYFIEPERLSQLQHEFNIRYHQVVVSRVISTVKNAGIGFSTADYFQKLAEVQGALHAAVRDQVENGTHITVPVFLVSRLRIPALVAQKQLQSVVQEQVNAKQLYANQAAYIRRETDRMVNDINNNATLSRQQASTNATAALQIAQAQAKTTVESARIGGTRRLFAALNMTKQTDRASLDFVLAVMQRPDVLLKLGYRPALVQSVV